jgi:hypothetical protein
MKNRSAHLFSALLVSAFIFLAYASAPDPSKFRKRKKKQETEESILSNPNLSQKEKDALLKKRNKRIEKERETNTISSIQLAEDYEANEVSADSKYKNKILYVEGYIDDIGKDLFDNIYVSLEGPSDIFGSVRCDIDDEVAVGNLKKGQWLVVRGRCGGTMLGVDMEDCEIIEVRDYSPEDEEEMLEEIE